MLDGLLGTAFFLAMGGRFRSLLPSDLRYVARPDAQPGGRHGAQG